jgi:ABC-2 type transport system permease protein
VIGYVAIAWIGRSLVFNNIDREIATQVAGGNIAQSLLKPVSFQRMVYFGAIGELGFRFLLFTIPISCVIFPLFGVPGPASPTAGALAVASFALAFLVNSGVNFITGAMALHLKSIEGLIRAKFILMELLTGTLVPLTFFPDAVRSVAEVLPFAGIAYFPVSIWMGTLDGELAWRAIGLQAFWAVALTGIGAAVWADGVRRTTVQGG